MNHPIDVIVPVYRGLQDVIDCLDSVKQAHYEKAFELIVIDDCSPEPEVSALLQARAKEDGFTLLVNEENLGFVATVNRGMQLHPERDVLLLNSDTLVVNDWLDRIATAAYSDKNIGTVTPFSNNATICSYPSFCQDNKLPSNTPLTVLDTLCATVNRHQTVEIPTGVGFCMYIRRSCLDKVGYFDVDTFGKGYGEENDFCQRAIKSGWKNIFALDVFVQHTGNVSFGDEHNELKQTALGKLAQHHPNYERDVHKHLSKDPARSARVKIWLASLISGTQPIVVHISHSRGGGTLRFVDELSKTIDQQAYSLLLIPSTNIPGKMALTKVALSPDGNAPLETEYTLYFDVFTEQGLLQDILTLLPVVGFHFHHMIDVPTWLMETPQKLGLPWLVTLHDYYYLCESISLTDTNDRFVGHDSVPKSSPWSESFTIFLNGASACLSPSDACRQYYQAAFSKANIVTVYHEEGRHNDHNRYPISPLNCSPERPLKVVVIGALSKIKGADLLETVANACAQQNIHVEFELLGYGYRELSTQPKNILTVSGRYQEAELPLLLQQRKKSDDVDLVWFTALWPETYSYTLSSAIEAGLPVIVPDIGAFAERVYKRPNSWVMPWDSATEQFVDLFDQLARYGENCEVLASLKSTVAPAAQAFTYDRDYLHLLGGRSRTANAESEKGPLSNTTTADWLQTALPLTNHSLSAKQSSQKALLNTLYFVKSLPLLGLLARCIPIDLQRKVRDKLLGKS